MIKLFGIPNCDTVKKARTYLEKKKLDYEFVDFKKTPPQTSDILRWKEAMGEWPVNKKGLTFKKYKTEFEALAVSKIPAFLSEHSSMIRRPILEKNGKFFAAGFDEAKYGLLVT
ncbi:MAG: ArsC/Spx/MgsR family protein [Bacteriovoracia bacterium]